MPGRQHVRMLLLSHHWLALGDPLLVPVHEWGHGVSLRLLKVALTEHFLLQGHDPLAVDPLGAGQVAEVGAL